MQLHLVFSLRTEKKFEKLAYFMRVRLDKNFKNPTLKDFSDICRAIDEYAVDFRKLRKVKMVPRALYEQYKYCVLEQLVKEEYLQACFCLSSQLF